METTADKPPAPSRPALRILVAEDSRTNQEVARHQLRKLGYTADVAADGQETIEAHQRDPYDVILMDCSMPVLDGYQATWMIRNRESEATSEPGAGKRVHIIAMTADIGPDVRQKSVDAGMDDYISKPVVLAELAAALERVHGGPAAALVREVVDTKVIAALRLLREPGEPDPVARFVELFVKDAPGQIQIMEDAIARNDISSLADTMNAASNLKGSAANLGAINLVSLSDEIEKAARLGLLAEAVPLVKRVREEFTRVEAALTQLTK